MMKWAAVAFVLLLYLASPYYALIELGQGIRAKDPAAISGLVDWEQLRSSIRNQFRAHLAATKEKQPTSDFEQKYPGLAAVGEILGGAFADAMINNVVTPQGIVNLLGAKIAVTQNAQSTDQSERAKLPAQPVSLFESAGFAFFISPIHFRLDLRPPNSKDVRQEPVRILLTFKGTGWQVTDVRLPMTDISSKMALAPNPPHRRQ